jgi:Rrf2 family protein
MKINRQVDYAVRAVLHLAQLGPGERAATARIAEKQQIPPTFLAKIVSQLAAAGVVRATRGARGGVALARDAADISLLDVMEAIDGPVTVIDCTVDPNACPMSAGCSVRPVWCDVRAEFMGHLRRTRFSQLVNGKLVTA